MDTQVSFVCSLFHSDPTLSFQRSTETLTNLLSNRDRTTQFMVGDLGYRPFGPSAARWERLPDRKWRPDLSLLSEAGRWATNNGSWSENRGENQRVVQFCPPASADDLHHATVEPMSSPPLVVRAHRSVAGYGDNAVATIEPNSIILYAGVKRKFPLSLLWTGGSIYLIVCPDITVASVAKLNVGRAHTDLIGVIPITLEENVCVDINFQRLYNRLVDSWMSHHDMSMVLIKAVTAILKTTSEEYAAKYEGWYNA